MASIPKEVAHIVRSLPEQLPGPFLPSLPNKPIDPLRKVQYRGLYKQHQLRKQRAIERRGAREVVELAQVLPHQRGRRAGSRDFPFDYPDCPRCGSDAVIRAGFAYGEQRFRCRRCRSSFYGHLLMIRNARLFGLRCHRCGGEQVRGISRSQRCYSGWIGYCLVCRKRFTQGGRHHLDNTMCLLLQRVQALELPRDVAEEAYQQACLAVLQGYAYTWNVQLDVAAARKTVYGEYQSSGVQKFMESIL